MRIIEMPLSVGRGTQSDLQPGSSATGSPGDQVKIEIGKVELSGLGRTDEIIQVFNQLGERVGAALEECQTELGEIDLNTKVQLGKYVESGEIPPENERCPYLEAVLQSGVGADDQQSRWQQVVETIRETIEGPLYNLANVAGRTGAIVFIAATASQYAADHVKKAIDDGDVDAWVAAALAMTGPALMALAAVRSELLGNATLCSRLGRIGLASLTVGITITAYMTGKLGEVGPKIVEGILYQVIRATIESCFPLTDNSGAPSVASTTVSTGLYSLYNLAAAEFKNVIPLASMDALVQFVIQGGVTAFGVVFDSFMSIISKSCLTPPPGRDSVFEVTQGALVVRADAQLPTLDKMMETSMSVLGARLSLNHFSALLGAVLASMVLQTDSDGDNNNFHIVALITAVVVGIAYFPFVFSTVKDTKTSYTVSTETNPA